jgi:beta-mannosidase
MKQFHLRQRTGILFLLLVFIFNAQHLFSQTVKQPLHQNWMFKNSSDAAWLPALVPGCVHTDLLHNQQIKDPYFRTNEEELQWIEKKDWEYSLTFNAAQEVLSKEVVELVFYGLDTYADVYLNGELILQASNMHRTWRVNCKNRLRLKNNKLHIYFHSAFKKALPLLQTTPYPLFQFPNNDQADTMVSMYLRKAGYHFGWDWGPRFVTAGIWKEVQLEAYDQLKISSAQISTTSIAKNKAVLEVNWQLEATVQTTVQLQLINNNNQLLRKEVIVQPGLNHFSHQFEVANPQLWWSNGLGKQHLYTFHLTASSQKVSDSLQVITGIRTLKVVTEKDRLGKSLYVSLNGKPVFMKGANYIPQDNFTNRTTEQQYKELIKAAADVNMNMLRVWGGGYFEKELFYRLCDEYGILVWQDMLFACGTYPGTQNFFEEVAAEVTDNITQIRNHPSLALYNGNNEVEVAYFNWGWKQKLSAEEQLLQEENHRKLFYEVIPKAIAAADTTRYYHPTSPNTGYNNIPLSGGDVHYWSVWHGKEPFESYNTNVGRFMSEYGFQSYPELKTIKTFTVPEDRTLDSKVMQAHQRCMADDRKDKSYGNNLIQHYMQQYYKQPAKFEHYLYISQLLQAKGMQTAIEAHRRNMPFCMGTLYWQINDCWPVASWSSIDYEGRWKAAHYRVKELYNQQLIAPVIENKKLKVYIVSDKPVAEEAMLSAELIQFNGKRMKTVTSKINIEPLTSKLYAELDTTAFVAGADTRKLVVRFTLTKNKTILSENLFYFVPEKEMLLESPVIKQSIKFESGAYTIQLQSNTLVKNLFIEEPDAKGSFSNNYFDLLPGKMYTVVFTPTHKKNIPFQKIQILSLRDTY